MATIDEMPAPAPADRSDGETAELQAQLNQLRAAATKEDALKNYSVAAEHYSQATEIQSELNGEMSVENADLLYLYGRCLYHVAVSKSDVLGGKVAGEETKKRKREPKPEATGSASTDSAQPTDKDAGETYLQIEGDENWMDEEEDVNEPDEPAAEEDDDDFETAYEILDVARVLLTRKLEQSEAQSVQNAGKGKAPDTGTVSPATRAIMERLADTRDLQAEISLENERWPDAVADERASLEIKQRIFPIESSLIAEAHFKLSLALEFASVTTMAADSNDPDGADVPDNAASGQMDQRARDESVQHMEKAIESCRARIAKEKAALATETEGSDKHTQARKGIEDVEDMIKDMETRLVDLRNPAMAVNGMGADPTGGLLESIMGAPAAQQKATIEQATRAANDLTGMVKRKKPKTTEAGAGPSGAGKRKAEELDDVDANGKKAKTT